MHRNSSGLLYNRITVRDGGIPEDDMVDYFIKSIKEQAQDSWLHFHCKAEVGRTTTFILIVHKYLESGRLPHNYSLCSGSMQEKITSNPVEVLVIICFYYAAFGSGPYELGP